MTPFKELERLGQSPRAGHKALLRKVTVLFRLLASSTFVGYQTPPNNNIRSMTANPGGAIEADLTTVKAGVLKPNEPYEASPGRKIGEYLTIALRKSHTFLMK